MHRKSSITDYLCICNFSISLSHAVCYLKRKYRRFIQSGPALLHHPFLRLHRD